MTEAEKGLTFTKDGNKVTCVFADGRELVVELPKDVTFAELERFVEHLKQVVLSEKN